MSYSSVLKQEKFWQVLKTLSKLEGKHKWEDVCLELSLTSKQLNSFLVFLREVDFVFELDKSEQFITAPADKPKVDLQFSLLEWLEFQAHFPYLEKAKGEPFHDEFEMKMEDFENEYKSLNLFSPLDVFEHSNQHDFQVYDEEKQIKQLVLDEIEKSVIRENVVGLEFEHKSFQSLKVFPRKIVYLDEKLSLICENISDHTLMQIELNEISRVEVEDDDWDPVLSKKELDDFVASIRKMSDFATRLILKIKSYEKFQLNLGHQFFENPCVFTNGSGDIIWAATIEPNQKIYEWLLSLGQDVEILESSKFKRKYLEYCESHLKKLA